MSIRELVKKIAPANGSYHLAQSSSIAHATICGLKAKLPSVMGATARGDEAYIGGAIAHSVLEEAVDTIQELWHPNVTSPQIMDTWTPHIDQIFNDIRQRGLNNGMSNGDVERHTNQATNRLRGLADTLQVLMTSRSRPSRIIAEVTISNITTRHEGRVDAIFEYEDHVQTVEWKTYADGGLSAYDRFQTISNGMLVNYRYGKNEDDFTENHLLVVTPHGIHQPLPTAKAIADIRAARTYVLTVLAGERAQTNLPHRSVCHSCSFNVPCRFYMYDNTDPEQRRLLWSRRFKILKKRAMTHVNKFLVQHLEPPQLRQLGLLDMDYNIEEIQLNPHGGYSVWLRKNTHDHRLYTGDSVRMISAEPGIPILACVSCNGSIRHIQEDRLLLDIYRGRPHQLQDFPIMLLRADVDLTKRELEAVDFVHRNPGRQHDIAFALLGEKMDDDRPA